MAPPTKMQKVKSKIRQQAEFWAGILEEIPFLEELEDISEAVARGQKRLEEVQTQVDKIEKRLAALSEEEQDKKLALANHVSTATAVAEAAEKRVSEADSRAEAIIKNAEAGARARADEIIAEAREEARRVVATAEERFASRRSILMGEQETLEQTVMSLRREEEDLREAVNEARALRAKLTALEPV